MSVPAFLPARAECAQILTTGMSSEPWTCSACTYVHEKPTELALKQCAMCGTPRAAAARHEPDAAAASEEEDNNDDSEEEDNNDEEDDEDDAFDACDAFDEPIAPRASDQADRAEKRKRLEQEHAFEKQESALAKQFAGNGPCEQGTTRASQPAHLCPLPRLIEAGGRPELGYGAWSGAGRTASRREGEWAEA